LAFLRELKQLLLEFLLRNIVFNYNRINHGDERARPSSKAMDLITITQEKDGIFKSDVRDHSFLSDMSVKDGGTDAAPSPADLVVSSLGFCFAMILQRYCISHEYSDQGIEISMTYLLKDDPKRISSITVDIALPEGFPEDRKQAVLNSCKTCVVFNSLSKDVEIDIDFED
jgi:uncharacterized OsmC-like protein